MSKKILGFKEEDGVFFVIDKKYDTYTIPKKKLIPVVLKSVYYTALKKKNKRIKKLLQIIKQKEMKKE